MMRSATRFVVALLAAALVGGLGPSATADQEAAFSLEVNRTALDSGRTLEVTASGTTTCTWVIEWNRNRRVGHGRSFTTSFTAPKVTAVTRFVLRATCYYSRRPPRPGPNPTSTTATPGPVDTQTIVVTVPPSWTAARTITVSPADAVVSPPDPGTPHNGGLPGTGGPRLWPLLVGLIAALVGAVLVGTSVRRPTSAVGLEA